MLHFSHRVLRSMSRSKCTMRATSSSTFSMIRTGILSMHEGMYPAAVMEVLY